MTSNAVAAATKAVADADAAYLSVVDQVDAATAADHVDAALAALSHAQDDLVDCTQE